MAKHLIVIADDDLSLHALYQRMFNRKMYDVRTASNGEEALKLVEAQVPSLLILDIDMPILDGFGVLAQLPRERRAYPVMVLTNNEGHSERSATLGADGFVMKANMTMAGFIETAERLLQTGKQG